MDSPPGDAGPVPAVEHWLSSHAMLALNAVLLLAALAVYGLECALEHAGVGSPDELIFEELTRSKKGERRGRRKAS